MFDLKKVIAMAAIAALYCAGGCSSCIVAFGLPYLIIIYFDISGWWLVIPIFMFCSGFVWVVTKTGVIDLIYWTPRRLIREWARMDPDRY
jgi:hypothetical protein